MALETPEGRHFAGEMTYGHGTEEMEIGIMTACDCGCNQQERIVFTLCGVTIAVLEPQTIDAMIKLLRKGRRELWGEP